MLPLVCQRLGPEAVRQVRAGRPAGRAPRGRICRGCYREESREECAACGHNRPPCTRREDGSALCQGCAPPAAQICVHCGSLAVPKVTRARGPVCRSCYEQPKRACGQCGRTSEIRARSAGEVTDLCQICYRRRRADTCTVCGRLRPGDRIGSTTFHCHSCRPRPTGCCCDCGRTRTVAATWPMGPLCGACHLRRRRNPRPCSRCGQTRVLAGRTDGHDLCGPCCGAQQLHFECRRCGFPGDIYTDGCCTRCVTRDRLEDLLSDQDGAVRPLFAPLIDALCAAKQPGSVLVWARGGPASRMLATLAAEEKPPTHASLDALPQNQTTRYLRALLVATAVLPWRNENFARLEHWLSKTVGPLPPHQARIIRPFAEWSILRDARRRAARGPYTAGAAAVDRGHIRAAITFLTWIDTHNLTLATLPQEHFDLWLTTHPTLHQPIRPFIQWALARRVAGPLALQRKPKALPSLFLTEQEQHEQLRRCLNDTALPLEIRIIGSFVRLYAQQVSKIVEFTTDRFHQDATGAYFTFGSNPVLLPPQTRAPHRAADRPARPQLHRPTAQHRTTRLPVPRPTIGTPPQRQQRPDPPARPRPAEPDRPQHRDDRGRDRPAADRRQRPVRDRRRHRPVLGPARQRQLDRLPRCLRSHPAARGTVGQRPLATREWPAHASAEHAETNLALPAAPPPPAGAPRRWL